MTGIDYFVLVAYFASMVAIGIWSMLRVTDQEDYFMGGRGFGKLLQTFAAFGAGTGAHEPVTVGRTGWTSGLSGVWSALMWLFVTPVYWIVAVWYRRMRHLTLGDWFVERYQSKGLGAAYTAFAILFYMFYLSTMLSAIAKFAVPLLGFETIWGMELSYVLIPALAVIVIVYGVLGGLTAAYYTDLIQGLFIIVLSVLLIPFGLWALVQNFGDPETMGVMDGFTILHQRISPDYFSLFSGPSAGEFPVQYIVSLSVLAMVGIVVQPHFIATGGGSAKSEDEARIGLVVGNFLKRLCTVGWALTALIALALLAGSAEIAADPDRVWGVAAREILGPLNLGLVGLMLACLIAAMMSSADTYMLVTSGLVTRNVYAAYIDDSADEKTYLRVGRASGLIMIIGASIVAITMSDVFGQFKLAVELPILFAAPFWVGMFWRRANRTAVWGTVLFSLVAFFLLPILMPFIWPGLQEDSRFHKSTLQTTRTIQREATEADIARHEAWKEAYAASEGDSKLIEKLGAEPPVGELGELITVNRVSGGVPLFWTGKLEVTGEDRWETVSETSEGGVDVVTKRRVGEFRGQGSFKVDFVLYQMLGIDLSKFTAATLESLRLPPRVLGPIVVLILLSWITRPDSAEHLDRYYSKMNTEVHPDPKTDREQLEAAFRNPGHYREKLLFPQTNLEFVKPRTKDVVGFLASCAVCVVVIGLLMWLAQIGA
ncbi:MAG TPA: hypothetical protein DDW52_05095 [Planctomycetaceae bacterium]|nr:hypothetical protein [Planctomycetaceae bacterium]